jgi:hypothetical protein
MNLIRKRSTGWRTTGRSLACVAVVLATTLIPAGPGADALAGDIEAETMTGAGTVVSDSAATKGKAVKFNGTRQIPAGVAAGVYEVRLRIKGANSRYRLALTGERAMEQDLGLNYQELAAKVWISGPTDVVSVSTVKKRPTNASAQPATLDWMRITPATGSLTVRGRRILAPSGQEVRLRGVETLPVSEAPLTVDDVNGIAAWGANEARLIVDVTKWLPAMCTYDASYAQRISDAVNLLTARSIFVMLKLNYSTKGKTCGFPAPSISTSLMADTVSNQFWQQMATRYKSNALVGFDLFNEPHDITEVVWRNGGNMGSWTAVGMQTLYNTIRYTAGATNLIFVNGIGWGYNDLPHVNQPLNGYGYIAGTHPYCLDCGGALPADIDAKVLPAQNAGLPVMVTEFGWNQPGGQYQQTLIDWAEAHDIGWSAYAFASWPVTEFGLLNCYNGCYAPNSSGAVVLDGLQANG